MTAKLVNGILATLVAWVLWLTLFAMFLQAVGR